MARSGEATRRRFVPEPIETTFASVRRTSPARPGPRPELTPDPSPPPPASPTAPEPQQRARERFHPQLIETSRRTRRACDAGPATRPADKTDITPYTNHIYVTKPRHRRKRGDSAAHDDAVRHMRHTRREMEDDGVKEYLLDLAAKEAARQVQEAALAAFPNSRAREGGVDHFYFRESSSGSDNSAAGAQLHAKDGVRRKSSSPGLNWWHKHMQEHATHLAHDRAEHAPALDDQDTRTTTDPGPDDMDLSSPPDPLWTTNPRGRGSLACSGLPGEPRASSPAPPDAWPPQPVDPGPVQDAVAVAADDGSRVASDERHAGRDGERGRPFGAFGLKPDDPTLHLMRQAASPPMLGKDLTFRRCPSPKQTRLETDHPFVARGGPRERPREASGQGGLWKGYCCTSGSNGGGYVASAGMPCAAAAAAAAVTPQPRATALVCGRVSEEPSPAASSPGSLDATAFAAAASGGMWTVPSSRGSAKPAEARDPPSPRRLDARERARASRDEKIALEFGDDFVTQVYNYLSLGYPATARSFDHELAEVSQVFSVEDLARDDARRAAKGHMLEPRPGDGDRARRCPRWRALKIYILHWARSHPDLDNLDPLAWGVRERRGSWAI